MNLQTELAGNSEKACLDYLDYTNTIGIYEMNWFWN